MSISLSYPINDLKDSDFYYSAIFIKQVTAKSVFVVLVSSFTQIITNDNINTVEEYELSVIKIKSQSKKELNCPVYFIPYEAMSDCTYLKSQIKIDTVLNQHIMTFKQSRYQATQFYEDP